MKNKMPRKALRALLAMLVAGCLCGIGCASASQTDWRALSIGVPLGWSADHFLTAQGLQVYRYDIPSQGVIAMQFGYIDALAVDDLYAPSVIQEFPQFTVMEEPIGSDSLVVQVTPTRQDLLEQINAFIPEFWASEEGQELSARAHAQAFTPNTDIPQHEDGPVIRVTLDTGLGHTPFVYYDFVTDSPQGLDVEFIKHFVWTYGYRIQWADSGWTACAMSVSRGRADIYICAISQYYVKEMSNTGACLCSDPYYDLDLVLLIPKEEGEGT